jgi:hypothetical protein
MEGGQESHGLSEILVSREFAQDSGELPSVHPVLAVVRCMKRTTSCGASWMRDAPQANSQGTRSSFFSMASR